MKKLFFCAAALLAAISFAACSDDDEPNLTATPENIAGTWQIVHSQGWESYGGEKEPWSFDYPDEDGWYYTLTFDKNNSCINTSYEVDYAPFSQNYSYSILDNILTLKNIEETQTFEIKKLTESELVLYIHYEISTESMESTDTYKRIK